MCWIRHFLPMNLQYMTRIEAFLLAQAAFAPFAMMDAARTKFALSISLNPVFTPTRYSERMFHPGTVAGALERRSYVLCRKWIRCLII